MCKTNKRYFFLERFSHFGLFGLITVCLLLFVIEL
jgi:hypothetical protein